MFFSDDEIKRSLAEDLTSRGLPFNIRKELDDRSASMVAELKQYKICAFAWAVDPNASIIIHDVQNPFFVVKFKNAEGQIKTRKIQAHISSWGLRFEIALRCNLIFFIDTDLDFENMGYTVRLGRGIDLGLAGGIGTGLTVAGFDRHAGAMVMLSCVIGVSAGMMMVTGGRLDPIEDQYIGNQ